MDTIITKEIIQQTNRELAKFLGLTQYLWKNTYTDSIEVYYHSNDLELSEESLSGYADDFPWDKLDGSDNPLVEFKPHLDWNDIQKTLIAIREYYTSMEQNTYFVFAVEDYGGKNIVQLSLTDVIKQNTPIGVAYEYDNDVNSKLKAYYQLLVDYINWLKINNK